MLDNQLEELTQRIAIEFYRAKSMMMGSVPVEQINSPLVGRIDIRSIDIRGAWTGINQLSFKSGNQAYNMGDFIPQNSNSIRAEFTNTSILTSSAYSNAYSIDLITKDQTSLWGTKSSSSSVSILFKTPVAITEILMCDLPVDGKGAKTYIIDVLTPDGTVLVSHNINTLTTVIGEVTAFPLNIPL